MIQLWTSLISILILAIPVFILSFNAGLVYSIFLLISLSIGAYFRKLFWGNHSILSPFFSLWAGVCILSVIFSVGFYLKMPHWLVLSIFIIIGTLGLIGIFKQNYQLRIYNSRIEIFSILLCATISIIWCANEFKGLHLEGSTYYFTPWLDNFYHAVWVDELSRYLRGYEASDPRAYGVPNFLYHTGQYAIASLVFAYSTSISSIDCYLRISTPLAFFIVGGAGYSFGTRICNRKAGLITLIILLCIPYADIGHIRSGWFNFYWLLLIHPSLGFGIGGASLIWIGLFSLNSNSTLYKTISLYFSAIFIIFLKAHILIINGLGFAISPLFLIKSKKRVPLTCLLLIGLFVASLVANWLGLPAYKLDGSGFKYYASLLTGLIQNQTLNSILNGLHAPTSNHFSFYLFIPIIVAISFGPILITSLILSIKYKSTHKAFATLVTLTIFTYVSFTTFGSAESYRFGMPEELLHRVVVWPQFLLCILTSVYFVKVLKTKNLKLTFSLLSPLTPILKYLIIVSIFLITPLIYAPKTSKSVDFGLTNNKLPTGLVEIAMHLNSISNKDDIFLSLDGDPDFIIRSISNVRSYYFRSKLTNHRISSIIEERMHNIESKFSIAEQNNNLEDILAWLRSERITYIITIPGHPISKLFINFEQIIYESNGYQLVKIKSS
jgi:hypothetical protein